jgi:hypothetical protein
VALLCPFPAARNPATTWAERHTLAWAQRWGLLPTRSAYDAFAQARFAELMGRAYPTADTQLLATIADWNSWTFLVDTQLDHDALGHDPARVRHLAHAVAAILGDSPCTPDASWPPLLFALADVAERLRRVAPRPWLRRFRHHVGLTLEMCVREALNRRRGWQVSEAVYREMRPHTSGVLCFFDLIEVATGMHLSDTTRTHPQVLHLVVLATEAIYLANDLASLEKERLQGDGNNLVLIVERERGLHPRAAVATITAQHQAVVGAFMHAADRLSATELGQSREVNTYVAGLGTWMRANLDWSQLTGRYQPAAPRADEVNAGSVSFR